MDSSLSFKRLFISSILLTPILTLAQCAPRTTNANQAGPLVLSSCLSDAGVRNIVDTAPNWANETTPWQLRLKDGVDPAAMAYPTDRVQLAASLACARNASVKVSVLGGGHSFVAYGFGNPGELVVNMQAFTEFSFNEEKKLATMGGGSRVGPVMKELWEKYQLHTPHVRLGRVGNGGSLTGGGYGSTSRPLGTPTSWLDSVEYMLYNGTVVNAPAGSDLLWAAQGAASSYGVLLSLTTRTWKPKYPNVVNYTLSFGSVKVDDAIKGFMAMQDFAVKDAPDELAMRIALGLTPFRTTGYFYGDPAKFDETMKPLMDRFAAIPLNVTITKNEYDWWTMETYVATGADLPEGGSSPGRSFYIQALTTRADAPLTEPLVRTLYQRIMVDFNRTDLRRSGLMDLWGGAARDVKDSDYAYQHGNNLWLIRFDTNVPNPATPYPADGVKYAQSIMKPFEDALVEAGMPLRGMANYRDSGLTEPEWSERLYGKENYKRLKAIKKVYDPEGMFTNNPQSISEN